MDKKIILNVEFKLKLITSYHLIKIYFDNITKIVPIILKRK